MLQKYFSAICHIFGHRYRSGSYEKPGPRPQIIAFGASCPAFRFHSPGALFRLLPRPVTGQLPRLSIGPANQLFLVCKAIFAQVTIPCLKGGIGMSTVRRKDKRIGVTYVYEQEKGVWDPQKKQMRSKRTLIGKIDPETGEVVPTKGWGKNRESVQKKDRQTKR